MVHRDFYSYSRVGDRIFLSILTPKDSLLEGFSQVYQPGMVSLAGILEMLIQPSLFIT